MAGMRQCGPPANTFLRCSTFGEKGSNSTPASRCLPRLCSIGEQSGERGLLRVANGATFIEITRAHVVAHPSPLHPREERERESFFLWYIIRFSWIPAGRAIRCDSSTNRRLNDCFRLSNVLLRTCLLLFCLLE